MHGAGRVNFSWVLFSIALQYTGNWVRLFFFIVQASQAWQRRLSRVSWTRSWWSITTIASTWQVLRIFQELGWNLLERLFLAHVSGIFLNCTFWRTNACSVYHPVSRVFKFFCVRYLYKDSVLDINVIHINEWIWCKKFISF